MLMLAFPTIIFNLSRSKISLHGCLINKEI